MKFKKLITLLLIAMSTTIVAPAFAADVTSGTPTEKTTDQARAEQLKNRLIEIKNMDKSNLTSEEKRELRKEVKEIRREARKVTGIYISIGALIIIILLLIIIL